jgi:cytochrome P450
MRSDSRGGRIHRCQRRDGRLHAAYGRPGPLRLRRRRRHTSDPGEPPGTEHAPAPSRPEPAPASSKVADARPGQSSQAQRELYRTVDDIIDRRSGAAASDKDLVSLLLAARDPETGAPLSPQEIRDQVLIFLLAGHDTTATALTVTMHLLGRHPDVQTAVHREIAEVLSGRPPHADDIPRLTLTAMAVKEAIRLSPPAYTIPRRAEHEVTIAAQHIPAGSIILLSPWATHRRPDPLARAAAVRALALRARDSAGSPTVRLLPIRRRPSRLHR